MEGNLEIKTEKSLISHFVGNSLANASLECELEENAEPIKKELLEKLNREVSGHIVDEVIQIIRDSDWSTLLGIENFRTAYSLFERKHNIDSVVGY